MSNQKMREALEAFLECPRWLDEATVPKAGIEANPNQVVVNMSVSLVKIRNAQEALAQSDDVGLTDEECLVAMHAAVSENLHEDDRIELDVFLKAYEEKIDGALAVLAGLRAVIAAHEAKLGRVAKC